MISRTSAGILLLGISLLPLGIAHAQTQPKIELRTLSEAVLLNPVKATLVGNAQNLGSTTRFNVRMEISNAVPLFESAIKRAIGVKSDTKRQYWQGIKTTSTNQDTMIIEGQVRLEYWASRKISGKTIQSKLRDEMHNVGYWLQPGISRGKLAIVSKTISAANAIDKRRQVNWIPPNGLVDPTLFKALGPKITRVQDARINGSNVSFTVVMDVNSGQLNRVASQNNTNPNGLLKKLVR